MKPLLKQLFFVPLLALLFSWGDHARGEACVVSSDLAFSDQFEVDGFVETYGACDALPCGLTIEQDSGIENLDGLSALKLIQGDLLLLSTELSDISGLSGLESPGRALINRYRLQKLKRACRMVAEQITP